LTELVDEVEEFFFFGGGGGEGTLFLVRVGRGVDSGRVWVKGEEEREGKELVSVRFKFALAFPSLLLLILLARLNNQGKRERVFGSYEKKNSPSKDQYLLFFLSSPNGCTIKGFVLGLKSVCF